MCEKELLAAEKNTALLQQVSDSRNRVQELLSSLENTDGTGEPANNDGAMEWLAEFSVDAEMRARRKLENKPTPHAKKLLPTKLEVSQNIIS